MTSNPIIPVTARALALIGTVTLGAACASRPREAPLASKEDACSTLKTVIAAAPNGFDAVKRGSELKSRLGVRWAAVGLLPHTSCEVWRWGGGHNHYLCLWNKADEAAAARFRGRQTAAPQLSQARLDLDRKTEPKGRVAAYTHPDHATQVELRFFADPRGYRTSWQTSLVVGDKAKDGEGLPVP